MKASITFIQNNSKFLLFGILLTFFSSYGQSYLFGLYNAPIRQTYDLTNGEFGSIYGLVTLLSAVLINYAGHLLDRTHLPYYSAGVLLILMIGCFIMGFASHFYLFVFALFLIRFAGQGLLGHAASTSMARYFDKTRGKAISISRLGFHFGEIVLPPLIVLMIALIGWKESWIILGMVVLIPCLPISFWLLKGHAERHDIWLNSEEDKIKAENAANNLPEGEVSSRHWTPKRVLMDWQFYSLTPLLLASPIIGTGVYFYMQNISLAKGWDITYFTNFFALRAVAVVVFALIAGALVDKFGCKRLLPLIAIPTVLALTVMTYSNHPAVAPIFMVLSGINEGFMAAVGTAIWAELYGTRYIGSIKAMALMIMVFSTAITPPAMGILFDQGVAVETITFGLLIYTVIAAFVTLPLLISAKDR